MNSEISNVLKLSPVTVAKADKQTDEKSFAGAKADAEKRSLGISTLQNDSTVSSSISNQEQDKQNEAKPSFDSVKKAADKGNSLLQSVNRNLQFKVDDSTKELVVKVVDSETGDVVRQIPSEEMLAFIRRMQELDGQQGSMIQDRA
ncbi:MULTISPECIES: flagellar protein FlaG [Methylomonas]|uniref:Flagellar biosynthesis protein FlaG n=2 Tax=Methylomonas TaxID=416 RepID=A0A126T6T6_9GAMM|nr:MULTISPECIES: flagellar protein FlaG [Methylomonas]AMK77768.1 flagellar biosynthesis protein FlaG [Methylomonas denitrificans]OAI08650.1 flagellar biosynthesis protein FlaG [Methylomonas methanica]TCV86941.1 flagellar protein FlaG [Methylomonas methanica]